MVRRPWIRPPSHLPHPPHRDGRSALDLVAAEREERGLALHAQRESQSRSRATRALAAHGNHAQGRSRPRWSARLVLTLTSAVPDRTGLERSQRDRSVRRVLDQPLSVVGAVDRRLALCVAHQHAAARIAIHPHVSSSKVRQFRGAMRWPPHRRSCAGKLPFAAGNDHVFDFPRQFQGSGRHSPAIAAAAGPRGVRIGKFSYVEIQASTASVR